jgi:putative polyketide hydroxylase
VIQASTSSVHTPVLIVGAGLAGLTAATLLAWRGVRCLLVERRPGVGRHPRARGLNMRSLELLRGIPGIEAELAAASPFAPGDLTIVVAENVAGRVFRTLVTPVEAKASALSPAAHCMAGQDKIEEVLLRQARALGADIRFGLELTQVEEDAHGVVATVRDAAGETRSIRADYGIAADGNRSLVRRALGVGTHGQGVLANNMTILFEADLSAVRKDRGYRLFHLRGPAFNGFYADTDDPNVAAISTQYDPARETAADYTPERAAALVRAAVGADLPDLRILDVRAWDMSSFVADRMAVGRVFLAGDAAHTMPPNGGLGGQSAIQDAADLAWKLTLVLRGEAGPGLLDTYAAERQPVAELTVTRQTAAYLERVNTARPDLARSGEEPDWLGVAIGYRYRSSAVQYETPDDGQPTESPLRPSGRPGTRLAHVALTRGGEALSTLDLVGDGFVVIAGPAGAPWVEAARRLKLVAFRFGADVEGDRAEFLARTGIGEEGALLVRPDGFIAWRAKWATLDPFSALELALDRALCRRLGKEKAA